MPHRLIQRCSCFCLLTLVSSVLLAGFERVQAQVIAQAAPVVSAPTVGATQIVLIVNPTVGNDAVADGSDRAPFKTITQALQMAPAGTVILLTPGTYSQETGETFPLRLKPDVMVQGNLETRGQGIVIQGSGFFLSPTFARQNVAIVGADRAILAGVTVKNPDPQGYGVWIESTSPAIVDSTLTESGHDGISVTGNGSPLIRNNYFYQNGANGITIYGTSRAEVRENIFEQTGFAININQKAAPLLVGNRITQNKDGILVQASAQPIVRNNSVDGNQRDGLVAIAQSRPDLGTATSPGGNSFRNNGQFDVNAQASNQPIPAFGNDLAKTTGTLDLAGTSLASTVSAGVPMPWTVASPSQPSGSRTLALATARSPVSSAKSTATDGRKASALTQKPTRSIAATNATMADTIPFGQRLGSDRAAEENAQAMPLSARPPATLEGNPAAGISAASFPVPVAQPSVSASHPRSLRPVTIVSLAIASPPVQGAAESSMALPPVVVARSVSPRQLALIVSPVSSIASRPIASAIRLAPLSGVQSIPRTGAIEIPVPAPERRSTVATVPAAVSAIASAATPLTSAGLLPVPNPDAPIGNVGNASIVYRTQQTTSGASFASRAALGLRYRVVVAPADDSQQTQLRAVFPNAFRTSIKGRTLMQVGAFGDRTKADQLTQTLNSQGIQAMVETVE